MQVKSVGNMQQKITLGGVIFVHIYEKLTNDS